MLRKRMTDAEFFDNGSLVEVVPLVTYLRAKTRGSLIGR